MSWRWLQQYSDELEIIWIVDSVTISRKRKKNMLHKFCSKLMRRPGAVRLCDTCKHVENPTKLPRHSGDIQETPSWILFTSYSQPSEIGPLMSLHVCFHTKDQWANLLRVFIWPLFLWLLNPLVVFCHFDDTLLSAEVLGWSPGLSCCSAFLLLK